MFDFDSLQPSREELKQPQYDTTDLALLEQTTAQSLETYTAYFTDETCLDDDAVDNINWEEYLKDDTAPAIEDCTHSSLLALFIAALLTAPLECNAFDLVLPAHYEAASTEPYTCLCSECNALEPGNRTFARRSDLKKHQKYHTGQNGKIHKCTEPGCGEAFHDKSNLKRHHLCLHTDERPHVCKVCQGGFKRKETLKNHQDCAAGCKSAQRSSTAGSSKGPRTPSTRSRPYRRRKSGATRSSASGQNNQWGEMQIVLNSPDATVPSPLQRLGGLSIDRAATSVPYQLNETQIDPDLYRLRHLDDV